MIEPVVLEGSHVRLEPLGMEHLPVLIEVRLDADLWRWTVSQVRTPQDMAAYVEGALAQQRQGTALPFATVDRVSGRVEREKQPPRPIADVDRYAKMREQAPTMPPMYPHRS